MASEKDIELLDDYLANKMSAQDRSVFEQNLSVNKDLQSELLLQQGVIDGVRKARVTELKNMLRNVPLSNLPSNPATLATKAIIGITATAFLGTLLYFALTSTKENTEAESKTEIVNNSQVESKPTIEPATTSAPFEPVEQVITSAPTTQKKKSNKSTSEPTAKEPVIDVFDPSSETDENSSEVDEEELKENTLPATAASISVIVEAEHRKLDFHYKFVADQITLFGSFEKNLYEILEFITDKKRTAFLYYKQTYYSIVPTNEATKLTPIQDPVLIQKLNDHRSQK